MTFNHENLKVYQRTVPFNAKANSWVANWNSRHAICDHLQRAAGSMIENIAMGSAAYSAMKVRNLDYAMGSALECAACLDLAGIKGLLDGSTVVLEKRELSEIVRMMIGLRKAWASRVVREDRAEYTAGTEDREILFHHETLDLYIVALEAAKVVSASNEIAKLPTNAFRRLDTLLTSVILNIAEGNGRFSAAEQRKFLGISHEAAIKMAARLDVCAVQRLIPASTVDQCKSLLARVAQMTGTMMGE
jgi:four helix bundle protein